ncbi:MAG TPA: hypothetical protein VER76_21995 [Pyrinomonadaceae bacterium]|nr:hypothetical protein [Pyrinomonadaceae bacterium]
MKKFLILGVMALLLGGATEASAQRRNNDRNDRERIRRGIRSGQITREEARQIRERERQLRAERRTYRSDGVLTREERREIRRDEREQDRYIRSQRRDDDRNNRRWRNRNDDDDDRRRGNGYYRRGAGSRSHPVFGEGGKRKHGRNNRWN